MLFVDRADAGRQLARLLLHLRGTDAVVLALPRGGVPVAAEVARELRAPLDVIVVRKLGVPFQPECGFGAIGEGGARIIDDRVVRQARLTRRRSPAWRRGNGPAGRRVQLRGGAPPVPLAGRTAVVVDDGIATGSTARAACLVARARGASRVIVAVPVGAAEAAASLRRDADEVICLHTPAPFAASATGTRTSPRSPTRQVAGLLGQAVTGAEPRATAPDPAEVTVDAGASGCPGRWSSRPMRAGWWCSSTAAAAAGTARVTSSSRPALNRAGLGTLLVDLLTPDEELSRANVFNVALLAARLAAITRWLCDQPGTAAVPLGYFGASTGTAAALVAATATRGSRSPPSCPAAAAGPGGRAAGPGPGAHPAHRGRRGHDGPRPQPAGPGAAEVREPARRRSRRHPPVPRAGSPQPGDGPGRRLVRPPLRPGGRHRGGGLRARPSACRSRTNGPARSGRPRTMLGA